MPRHDTAAAATRRSVTLPPDSEKDVSQNTPAAPRKATPHTTSLDSGLRPRPATM